MADNLQQPQQTTFFRDAPDTSTESLRRRMMRGSSEEMEQGRAINIDKFQQVNAALSRTKEELTRARAAFKANSAVWNNERNKNSKAAKAAREGMLSAAAAVKTYFAAVNKLTEQTRKYEKIQMDAAKKSKAIHEQERKKAELKQYSVGGFLKRKGGEGLGTFNKVEGVMGQAIGAMLTRAVLKAGMMAPVGAVVTGMQLLAEVFGRATKNTSNFVNAFGALGGLYLRANMDFQHGTMGFQNSIVKSADMIKFAGTVWESGAFGAYTAARAGGASAETMAGVMGELTPKMILAGRAMGLTSDQSAQLMVSLHNTMGAFGAINQASKAAYLQRAEAIFKQLTVAQYRTGFTMAQVTGITKDFSATLLPLGHSFDSTLAAITGTVGALNAMVDASDEASRAYFNNADTMKQFVSSLFNIGKGIRPGQALGYSMAAGAGGRIGNVFKDYMSMVSASPLQRMGLQVQAFQKVMGGDMNKVGMALSQSGYSDEVLAPLFRLATKSGPGKFSELIAQMASNKFEGMNVQELGAVPGFEGLADLGAKLKLGEDPLENIANILNNILQFLSTTLLGVLAKDSTPLAIAASFKSLRPGSRNSLNLAKE